MGITERFAPLLAFCLLGLSGAVAAPGPGEGAPELVLTSREGGTVSEERFPCEGTLYAYLSFPKGRQGKQALEALWVRPDGVLQEKTVFDVDFSSGASRKAFFWIKFHPKKDRLLDEFPMGGDYGRKAEGFGGLWTLEVLGDGKGVLKKRFTLECPE